MKTYRYAGEGRMAKVIEGGDNRATGEGMTNRKGADFERQIADHLAALVNEDIDRRVKTGRNDKGDIKGLRHMGGRIVVECKNYAGKFHPGPWLEEAERERANDDALAGVVIAKRRGIAKPGKQIVIMTVDELIAILTGERVQ